MTGGTGLTGKVVGQEPVKSARLRIQRPTKHAGRERRTMGGSSCAEGGRSHMRHISQEFETSDQLSTKNQALLDASKPCQYAHA